MSSEQAKPYPYEAKKSMLQIFGEKFGIESEITFYNEQVNLANKALGLDGGRDDFPNCEVSDEHGMLGSNNVYGIYLAEKREQGKWTGEPAIVLFVARKAPLERIELDYQAQEIGRKFFDNKLPTDVFEQKVIRGR